MEQESRQTATAATGDGKLLTYIDYEIEHVKGLCQTNTTAQQLLSCLHPLENQLVTEKEMGKFWKVTESCKAKL